jgi:hypothetical protein
MARSGRAVAIAAVGLLAACGSESEGAAPSSSDVTGPAWAPGEEWRLEPEPRRTIGSVDGPEAIGSVGRSFPVAPGIALLEGGRLAFADHLANEIRIYDSAGRRFATAGRTGDGPGEFQGLRAVERFRGDSLVAWDSRAGFFVGRISLFTAEGDFVRTLPVTDFRIGLVVGVQEDGTLLAEPQATTPPGWENPTLGEFREPRLYQRISTVGSVLDAFGPVTGREMVATGLRRTTLVLYGRDTYVSVGARVIYTGDSGGFEILAHDPETGRVLRRARRPYEPAPVARELIEARRSDRQLDSLTSTLPDQVRDALRATRVDPDDIPARETHPVFNRIMEDAAEHLWVRHQIARRDSVRTWSVFDPRGTWLGEIDTPVALTVHDIGADDVAVVRRDDLGVEYVEVYRILK